VFVHGDLTWDRFHLMISRSTTPELIKMIHKLDEFITQQQTSSKRALSVLATMTSTSKPSKQKLKDDGYFVDSFQVALVF
jgi:Fragile site-associated protein C-terminus